MISEALGLLRSSLPTTIEIRQQLAEDVVILGDATRMHQIIMNLGTNAGLAMLQGGILEVELTVITTNPTRQGGPWAQITVRDSGVGMSPRDPGADLRTVLHHQGEKPGHRTRPVGGSRHHRGWWRHHRRIERTRTRHHLHHLLPLATERAQATPSIGKVIMGHGERILFVDDELPLCELAMEMLGELNYQVVIAHDGVAALEILANPSNGPFDLLITDATMPRMTGIELIAAARERRLTIPVILCSGQDDRHHGPHPDQICFLAKPVSMAALATAIRETLAGRTPGTGG